MSLPPSPAVGSLVAAAESAPARFWDQMFTGDVYRYGKEPNAFVAEQLPAHALQGGRVLCVGDGEGRNGVWCASQGFDTVAMEPSSAGVARIRSLAAEKGVTLTVLQDLMPSSQVTPGSFDAVVLSFIHVPPSARSAFHAACVAALKPGGVIVLEAFTPAQIHNSRKSGGPAAVDMMFTADLLAADFAALELVLLAEQTVMLSEGPGHSGDADVVRLVARLPRVV
jgi:2-polyprenyl-3-methyl-5-hydroxy-6-metoxy-1,4-benzoquinol methylase